MSIRRAEEVIGQAVSEDGAAVDPATILLLVGIVTRIVSGCLSRSRKQADVVAAIRSPSAYSRRKFRDALRAELGTTEYERRGGKEYAEKVLRAGRSAKVADIRSYVSEVSHTCGT